MVVKKKENKLIEILYDDFVKIDIFMSDYGDILLMAKQCGYTIAELIHYLLDRFNWK